MADVYTKAEADTEFMTQNEVDARINTLINASDPTGGKTITDIQNLVKYVDENAGEIAALVDTTNKHNIDIQKNTDDIASINITLTNVKDTYATEAEVKEIQESLENDIKTINEELDTHGDVVTHNVVEFEPAGAAGAAEGRIKETLKGYYTKDEANIEFTTPTEVITEVNKALAEVSNIDSITNITTLVNSVNTNTADLKELITEVYGKTEMTGDSRLDLVEERLDTIEGEAGAKALAQGVKEVVDTNKTTWDKANTAIQTVDAGTDIVTTPGENGTVVVTHQAYTTGTVKDATLDSITNPYFITGIAINNGHVTDAATRTFDEFFGTVILDCGNVESEQNK